jgi:hypothetical protein
MPDLRKNIQSQKLSIPSNTNTILLFKKKNFVGYTFMNSTSFIGCKPVCTKLCPLNSQLDITACKCNCNIGYTPQIADPITGCSPTCKGTCPPYSYYDQTKCSCVCNPNSDLVNGTCLPSCRRNCPPNSVLDPVKCACVCNAGSPLTWLAIYSQQSVPSVFFLGYNLTEGYCVKNCHKKCPIYSTINNNSCVCTCFNVS